MTISAEQMTAVHDVLQFRGHARPVSYLRRGMLPVSLKIPSGGQRDSLETN